MSENTHTTHARTHPQASETHTYTPLPPNSSFFSVQSIHSASYHFPLKSVHAIQQTNATRAHGHEVGAANRQTASTIHTFSPISLLYWVIISVQHQHPAGKKEEEEEVRVRDWTLGSTNFRHPSQVARYSYHTYVPPPPPKALLRRVRRDQNGIKASWCRGGGGGGEASSTFFSLYARRKKVSSYARRKNNKKKMNPDKKRVVHTRHDAAGYIFQNAIAEDTQARPWGGGDRR